MGLRARLLLLVLVAVVPGFGLLIYAAAHRGTIEPVARPLQGL